MKYFLIILLLFPIYSYSDSSYVKKYCLALNTSSTLKYTDMNLYAYTSIYNKKHDYLLYVNYFNRTQSKKATIKDYSFGFFYDYLSFLLNIENLRIP